MQNWRRRDFCDLKVKREINALFINSQQIAGYTAGVDYPNFSEVPKGGSFSCQNRLPGEKVDSVCCSFDFGKEKKNICEKFLEKLWEKIDFFVIEINGKFFFDQNFYAQHLLKLQ